MTTIRHFKCSIAVAEAAEFTARRHTVPFCWLSATERDGHTLSCFLMALHTCRGYEQGGINITGSTHFHLTLTSPSAPRRASPNLPSQPPLSRQRVFIGRSAWVSPPRRLKCHRLPDVSLKSPVPPLCRGAWLLLPSS